MGWLTSFPYKWQVLEITLGLVTLVGAGVFFLISRGMTSPLWLIMAATSVCIGSVCTVTGTVWCLWSLRHAEREHEIYGRIKDGETDTLTCGTSDK